MNVIDNLKIGSIITNLKNELKYRVIYIFDGLVVMVFITNKDSKLEIIQLPKLNIVEEFNNQVYIIEPPKYKQFDFNSLSERNQNIYNRNLDIVNTISKAYGPCYFDLATKKSKPIIKELSHKYNISSKTILGIEKKYLMSGFDTYSLISEKGKNKNKRTYANKTGRPSKFGNQGIPLTNEIKDIFVETLKYHLSKRSTSYQTTYDWMCAKYFTDSIEENSPNGKVVTFKLRPENERPTKRQMEYFIRSNTTAKQRKIAKTSAREYQNNLRILKSDNLYNVNGPGDVLEMDEVEMDVALRSEINPENTIGRVIVHCMIDVYSRMIVAVSVSLENNSILGFTNCLINLAEDKKSLCKKYGLEIKDGLWDVNIYPNKIRTDRGSEYRSKEVKRILRELGITLELEPAAMGSMKGQVEQLFHQYHSVQNEIIENHGLITKRHDSKHHEQAVLTLDDIWVFVINQTIAHNMLTMKNYPLTREMIKKGIAPTPIEIWNYGCTKYGSPRPITNLKQFEYTIRKSVKAKISRKGIEWNGLYYIADNAWLNEKIISLGNKKETLPCRIDPRNIGTLWYLQENQIIEASLNTLRAGNSEYNGMSLKEYEEYKEEKKRLINSNAQRDEEVRIARRESINVTTNIATESMKDIPVTSIKTHSIRTSRKEESKFNLKTNSINNRLNGVDFMAQDKIKHVKSQETKEDTGTLNSETTIEELLDMFTNSKTF